MMKRPAAAILALAFCASASAQNPVIRDQFCADPTARVFDGRLYLYPSHDIVAPPDYPRGDEWFCMADYHVFSSDNLVDWTDHGVVLAQDGVPWVMPRSYSMWAPDCVEKGGKYYFYFPSRVKGEDGFDTPGSEDRFGVGVALGDSPVGPFVPEPENIEGIEGIDPCVLQCDGGKAYIYWSQNGIWVAELSEDMLSLASKPKHLDELPDTYVEGPFAFFKDGIYYLTYPMAEGDREVLAYSVSDSPTGPFENRGVFMGKDYSAYCWTNHHSIVEYRGQWYLFYHHNDYDPGIGHHRSVKAEKLFFEPDGTIREVVPTKRGVGVVPASGIVEIDRYSRASQNVTERFVDESRPFEGWCVTLPSGASLVFDEISFSRRGNLHVRLYAAAPEKACLRLTVNTDSRSVSKIIHILPSKKIRPGRTIRYPSLQGIGTIRLENLSDFDVSIDKIDFIR